MRFLSIMLGVVLSLSVALCAEPYEDLRDAVIRCAELQDDIARLECYDCLAKDVGLNSATISLSEGDDGAWQTMIDINPLDDSAKVVLVLEAESGHSAWGDPIHLIIRCLSGATEVYISWDDYLGSEATVTWRVGSEPARSARWSLSTDHDSTFYPYDDISFIMDLMAASRLVAQVTPYSEAPVTAIFDLTGLSTAIEPLRDACGW